MNLAESTIARTSTEETQGSYIPQQMKLRIPESLTEVLHEQFVGKAVDVGIPGSKGATSEWTGVLQRVAEHNGQITLCFKTMIFPYQQIRYLRIKQD